MVDDRFARGMRLAAWLGPAPRRVDVAWVDLAEHALQAHGTSTCAQYCLTYRLATTAGWVTRALDVTADGPSWRRTLRLRRSPDGRWSARRTESVDGRTGADDVVDLPSLGDALDCDLGLCPLTNTMPILRAGLVARSHAGEAARLTSLMAWVSVPDLHVEPSLQRYSAGPPAAGGGAHVDFSAGDFAARIEVDRDGIVVHYPGIGRRLDVGISF